MKNLMKMPRLVTGHYLLPIGVVAVLITLVVLGAGVLRQQIFEINGERLESSYVVEEQEVLAILEQKFTEYSLVLRAARGLFDASETVDRSEWQVFTDSLDLETNFPAIYGIGFARKVADEDKDSFVQGVQNDFSIEDQGYPEYKIIPDEEHDEYYVVDYLEPFSGNEGLFGFDLLSEDSLSGAVTVARDTGGVVVTEPVSFVQGIDQQRSVLFMMPIYRDDDLPESLPDRREQVTGVVFLVVRAPNMFAQIVLTAGVTRLDGLSVIDITNQPITLATYVDKLGNFERRFGLVEVPLVQTARVNFGGRIWEIDFKSDEQVTVGPIESALPAIVLVVGIIISVLVGLVLSNLLRVRAEAVALAKELTRDLQKFQLAVDAASDQIVITDAEGTVLYANPATERITGYKVEEVIGTKAGKLWGGLMEKEFYQKMWKTIKEDKKNFEGELKNKRKNGVVYDASSKISPVLGPQGKARFFVAIERDISAEKDLDRAKDEFLSVASHELRTPLTAIDGLVSMMREGDYGKVTKNLEEPLADIGASSERLIHLVNDLLSVTRMEAGRLKYELSEFGVKEVVDETVGLLKVIAEEKGLEIKVEDLSEVKVQADRDKVEQVLNNIIGNSLKFTEKGGITISGKEAGELLEIYIKDTGRGIPEEEQNKLFGKFQQVSSGNERTGTGLGLYITKGMCLKMGGDLTLVSSEVGKGSTFMFSLPLSGSATAGRAKEEIAEEAKENPDQKADVIHKQK